MMSCLKGFAALVALALPLLNAVDVSASSLSDLCTMSNVQAALPANGTFNGIHSLERYRRGYNVERQHGRRHA